MSENCALGCKKRANVWRSRFARARTSEVALAAGRHVCNAFHSKSSAIGIPHLLNLTVTAP